MVLSTVWVLLHYCLNIKSNDYFTIFESTILFQKTNPEERLPASSQNIQQQTETERQINMSIEYDAVSVEYAGETTHMLLSCSQT